MLTVAQHRSDSSVLRDLEGAMGFATDEDRDVLLDLRAAWLGGLEADVFWVVFCEARRALGGRHYLCVHRVRRWLEWAAEVVVFDRVGRIEAWSLPLEAGFQEPSRAKRAARHRVFEETTGDLRFADLEAVVRWRCAGEG